MPELPEVQTIVDDLNKKVVGQKITAAWCNWPKLKAVEKTIGHEIKTIKRRGKNILFYLNYGGSTSILLVHQKMTGHLLIGKWKIADNKAIPLEPPAIKEKVNGYIHFVLTLDDGRMIGFSDLRKFGKVLFGSRSEIENLSDLSKLGPDALDLKLSANELWNRLKNKSKTIYQTLMDQEVIAGIGNIYASDILHEAKIHPFKISKNLKLNQVVKILKAARKILQLALKLRGTSIADYRDTAGEEGYYAQKRLIYQREGEKCRHCGHVVKRVKKGGRSAFFCSKCQKL